MNSMVNLAAANLKAGKTRSLLVVLTIILATCLLTCIGILSYSIRQMAIAQVVDQTGRVHAKYKNLTENQIETLRNNAQLEAVGEVAAPDINVCDSRLGNISLALMYTDHLEMANMKLKEGRLPYKADEIALQRWIIEKLGLKPEIGETVNIDCIVSTKDGEAYQREYRFILCGILEDKSINKDLYISNALVSKAFIEDNDDEVEVIRHANVRVKGLGDLTSTALSVGRSIGVKDEDIKINSMYINALGGDLGSMAPFIFVGIIVVLAAAIVIYNIFHISVVYRVNQFGILAAVGATRRQVQRVVFAEGLLLLVAGIPAGLVLGYAVSFLVIPLLSMEELSISTSPYVFILAALVSLFTVVVAIVKPAGTASKASPIEAIRFTGSEATNRKGKGRGRKSVSIGRIAWLNLWRNRRRTLVTMLSLIMSGALFIIFSTILSGMSVENLTTVYVTGDFQLTSHNVTRDSGSDPLNTGVVERIKKLNGVESVNTIMHDWVYMDVDPGTYREAELPPGINDIRELNADIYGYDDTLMAKQLEYLLDGNISLQTIKNENKVLVISRGKGDNGYQPGDRIKVKKYSRDKTCKEIELIVAGNVSKGVTWIGVSGMGPTFVAHHKLFERLGLDSRVDRVTINIDSGNYDALRGALKQIAEDNRHITCMSHREVKEQRLKEIRGMQFAAMGLVGIIGIIGILNLINTMITSIIARKKEIGMLQAVGLSDTQLGNMLQLEGFYYSGISAVMSILIGTGAGYLFFQQLKKSASYAEYVFPSASIAVLAVVYVIVQAAITFLVVKRIRKDSIIDRIRYQG